MSDANLEKDLNATGDVFKYLHGSMKVRVMGVVLVNSIYLSTPATKRDFISFHCSSLYSLISLSGRTLSNVASASRGH